MRLKVFMLGVFLLAAGLSCSTRSAKTGSRLDYGPELMFKDLKAYNDAVTTLEGKALVVYKAGERVASLKASIAADKEHARYRLEIYDYVFNRHLVSVVRNGDEVHATLHTKNETYDVSYEEFQLQEVTGIAIPKEIVLKSMIGEIYLQNGETRVAAGESANSLLLEYSDAREGLSRETVLFDESGVPVSATFEQDGKRYLVTFSRFKITGGCRFPSKIIIQGGDRSLEVNYTELRINPVLADQAFHVSGR